VPITYNFSLLKNRFPEAQIQLKIGYSAGLNFLKVDDNNASLPVYSCTRFSHGLTLGFSGLPFTLGTSSKLGFHFDLYRGTQVYKDFYNEARKECGSSYARVGVVYQFNAGK
jgi:hypothetical protein